MREREEKKKQIFRTLEKGRNGHGEVLKMVHFTDDPSNDETKDEAEDANDFIVRYFVDKGLSG